MAVHYQRHGKVGVIQIDNPPVNALSHDVRSGLIIALKEGIADRRAYALVVMAEGRTFIAGADIREFGKPPQAPLLSDVITQLEACPKHLIAALHGTALGGGLEVALGCHYRIALAGTRVGLPEVKLGLLPGAGGTQRLPRLIGVKCALEIITSGRFIGADEALETGIIDAISDAETPLDAGLLAAQDILAGKTRTSVTGQLPAPEANPKAVTAMREHLTQISPNLFSPFRIVEAIEACVTAESLSDGLHCERELFLDCMNSPQRAGLIHLFFAARSLHIVPGVENATPFENVALIGEHPLFEQLIKAAQRANIQLTNAPKSTTELCILAPGADAIDAPSAAAVVALQALTKNASSAELSLILAKSGPFQELVNHSASASIQQRTALTLKALRINVVVSKAHSLLTTLYDAMKQAPTCEMEEELERTSLKLAESDNCYRKSDIDLLAVEALGYPRHLGGPHYQASLSRSHSSTSPEDVS